MRLLGTYEDTYVRENGRWRFRPASPIPTSRTASSTLPAGVDADRRRRPTPGGETPAAAAGRRALARLRRLEDLEQISQLFIDYKIVLDRQDFAAYADLFAEDGEFVASPHRAERKGRAAIKAMVEAMPGSLLGPRPARISTSSSTR